MGLRTNATSMSTPDPYGNMFGSMIPNGLVKPSTELAEKRRLKQLAEGLPTTSNIYSPNDPYGMVENAKKSVENLKPLEKPESEKYQVDAAGTVATGANAAVENYKASIDAGGSTKQAGIAAGIGAASVGAQVGGEALSKNKREGAGGALKGAATGAAVGASVGSIIPGVGNLIGAGVGAVVGAGVGLISGNKKKKARIKAEAAEEKARLYYNTKIGEIKRKTIGQATDLARYQGILSQAQNLDEQGNLKYRKGGILKYSTLNVREAQEYLNSLEKSTAAKTLAETPIIPKLEKGGDLVTQKTKVFKKCKLGGNCGCEKCDKKSSVPIFKRGGPLDLQKKNVIVDGPSHEELNRTGVKGDRGLPIVKNGLKVAEIESKELLIHTASAKKIEDLRKKIKAGDKTAEEELGKLLAFEISENTYDYSNLLKD
jgi:hypothetical protein